jgi:cell division protease FtsH
MANDEREQTLNQLLAEMDGFANNDGILVIAATNRKDILDAALLRPGRFDRIIKVSLPDKTSRRDILGVHAKNKQLAENVNLDFVAELTTGFSGAQLKNLLNEAAIYTARRGEIIIQNQDVLDALEKLVVGLIRKVDGRSEEARRRVAVHEIGHLLLALHSEHFEKPSKVTIDSSVFSSIGYTVFERNDVDQGFFLREYLTDHLKVLLGGRVAEETVYGNSVSSGAFSDLETAFGVAKKMIMEYGMGTHIIFPHFSESYRKRIDQEIHLLISNAYVETKKYLLENKALLLELSEKLVEQKTLYPRDFTS